MRLFRLALAVAGIVVLTPGYSAPPSVAAADSSELIVPPAVQVSDRNACDGSINNVMTNLTGKPVEILEDLQVAHQETPGFRAVVWDGRGANVIVDRSALPDWQKRLAGTGINVAPSCVSESLVRGAREAIENQDLGDGEWTTAGYNALTDSVDVETTSEPDTVRALDVGLGTQADADTFSAARDSEALRIKEMPEGPVRQGRFNDLSPFRGGAYMLVNMGGGLQNGCSTGVYINSPTYGTVMVTAGHCSDGANGKLVVNGDETSQVGTIEGALFPDPDLALIDGRNYNPRSFAANNNTTIKEVTASGEPTTGSTYCQYGAMSQRKCYAYDQLFTTFCDEAGCTHLLAHANSSCGTCLLAQGGDSGGGVFFEKTDGTLSFRGIHIAGGCNSSVCFSMDHKRSALVSHYDANIMTP